jgi:hypothetical protein
MFVEFDYFSHYLCREIDNYFRFKLEDMMFYYSCGKYRDIITIFPPPLDSFSNQFDRDCRFSQFGRDCRFSQFGTYDNFVANLTAWENSSVVPHWINRPPNFCDPLWKNTSVNFDEPCWWKTYLYNLINERKCYIPVL